MATLRGDVNRAPSEAQQGRRDAREIVQRRLKALVLLGGTVRPTELSAAVHRSVLDLPIDDHDTVLGRWHREAAALAEALALDHLPVRVMVNRGSIQPKAVAGANHVVMEIEEDPSDFRGTAGVLRDTTEEYDDDDCLLVASGAQVMLEPLADLYKALAATEADVTIVSHEDGTPSSAMLLRCRVLRTVSEIGFVDMKEQALPLIARDHRVRVVHRHEPSGLPIRTLSDYIHALRWFQCREAEGSDGADPFAEQWRPTFRIVEEGARLDEGVRVHDSVVLSGGHVERDAVLVQSVVCPGGLVKRKQIVTDRLVVPDVKRPRRRGSE